MAFRISTKMKNLLNDAFAAGLLHGAIYVYDGSQPATSDAAPTGTLLGIATVGSGAWTSPGSVSNGIDFNASSAGALTKSSSEVWSFVGLAAGTMGWFRHVSGVAADSLTTDTNVYARADGRISTPGGGGEITVSNLQVEVGATSTIDTYGITWPVGF